MQKPNVVHLSTVHPWTDNRVFRRQCRSLSRRGYDVTLIAVADRPQTNDGVRIVPAPRTPSRLTRMSIGVARALLMALQRRAAVYHLHDPELIPLIPILRLRGARVVYDAHEDLPSQVLSTHYLPPASRRVVSLFARGLCWFAGRMSSHIIAATPTIGERFPTNRTTVIHNYPELLNDVDSAVPYESRDNIVIYAGLISEGRSAVQMVDALDSAGLANWRLVMAGHHSPPRLLADLQRSPGWPKVEFNGVVPSIEARQLTSSAKVGFVLLQPTPAHMDALPTKLFENMAAGVPVIASDFPLWRTIIEEIGCGILVDPKDPTAIGRALRTLAEDPVRAKAMGARGRQAILERLNWTVEEQSLTKVYEQLVDLQREHRRRDKRWR